MQVYHNTLRIRLAGTGISDGYQRMQLMGYIVSCVSFIIPISFGHLELRDRQDFHFFVAFDEDIGYTMKVSRFSRSQNPELGNYTNCGRVFLTRTCRHSRIFL
jgi:hypothetical protein